MSTRIDRQNQPPQNVINSRSVNSFITGLDSLLVDEVFSLLILCFFQFLYARLVVCVVFLSVGLHCGSYIRFSVFACVYAANSCAIKR